MVTRNVIIIGTNGDQHTYSISSPFLIRQIKEHISSEIGIPIPYQSLYSEEKELKNGDILETNYETLYLLSYNYTQIPDQKTLFELVNTWCSPDKDKTDIINTYGPIQHWWFNESITSISKLFKSKTTFNEDISGWDMRHIQDMSNVFESASSFNINIGGWNTSNVIYFNYCFCYASTFNQPITYWNTSNAKQMLGMFIGAVNFDQNLFWNTSNVIYMEYMFYQATLFNGNITSWDTSKVKNMMNMFRSAYLFHQDISHWNTSSLKYDDYMFLDTNMTPKMKCKGTYPSQIPLHMTME